MNLFSRNPYTIYLLWVVLFCVYCLLIPFLSKGHNGGEQLGLTLLGHGLNYFIEGLFAISVITSLLYITWFKAHRYINVLIMVITGSMIVLVIVLNGGISSLL